MFIVINKFLMNPQIDSLHDSSEHIGIDLHIFLLDILQL